MFSSLATVLFYSFAIFLVRRRCVRDFQCLTLGTLPVAWISICGISGFLSTMTGIPALVTLSAFLLALSVAAISVRRNSTTLDLQDSTQKKSNTFAWLAYLPWVYVAGCAFFVALQVQQLEPRGCWDSLFTWVLRARFFVLGGNQWENAFSEDLALLHPDYPPLLSWALSSLWAIDQHESALAVGSLYSPLWLGFAFLVVGWKSICRGDSRLDLTIAAVIAMPILWKEAASKFSDFALAYSILASCAWYRAARDRQNRWAIVVAGFMAVWSGLIKNEGIPWALFFLFVTTCELLPKRTLEARRDWISLLAGTAVPLLAIVAFKLLLSPPNDLSAPERSFEIGQIVQPGVMIDPTSLKDRLDHFVLPIIHRLIRTRFIGLFSEGQDWGIALWWWIAILVYRFRDLKPALPLLFAVALQAVLYYVVYVISPYHLYWHLSNSISRIMTHVVPAGLCLTAFVAHTQTRKVKNRRTTAIASERSKRWAWIGHVAACVYFVLMPTLIVSFIMWKNWQIGKQPAINLTELSAIEFPKVDLASYVTSDLGTQSLYSTQYQAVPTILVVDRREPILLARFRSEDELRTYCDQNKWQIVQNAGGLGWARDAGGTGLTQPVKLTPIR